MKVISIKENVEYKEIMIKYFIKHWASDESMMVYQDGITNANKNKLPNWYLLLDNEEIVGCVGLISNDFVSRMDLYPYLCALYIEEKYRGHNYGSLLIEKVKQDCYELGYDKLYLCTNHINYYEKFGFKKIAIGYHPWGKTSKIYECVVNNEKYDLYKKISALIDKNIDIISILSNVSSLLKKSFVDVSWAGFYLTDFKDNSLYLGPFQGDLACVKIAYGKGVCGTCLKEKKAQLVEDVLKHENHIACSSKTRSEVVVPIIKDDIVYGVIDLDSYEYNNFTKEDIDILNNIAKLISKIF